MLSSKILVTFCCIPTVTSKPEQIIYLIFPANECCETYSILYWFKVRLGFLITDEFVDGKIVLLQDLPLPLQVGQLDVRLVVEERLLENNFKE